MVVPKIGQGYRGVDGHSGYLLRQAWHAFRGAMEQALRPYGLTSAQSEGTARDDVQVVDVAQMLLAAVRLETPGAPASVGASSPS